MSLSADKLAMSKALGAAFLSHQVEQLERSVAEANWRNNRNNTSNAYGHGSRHTTYTTNTGTRGGRGKTDSRPQRSKENRRSRDDTAPAERGTSSGQAQDKSKGKNKNADIVIADASLLIYGLSHVKKWSNHGREEVVIVPLEALNTLDALKKGNSVTARLARQASRWLENQVGSNDRILVQRDEAYLPWGELTKGATSSTQATSGDEDKEDKTATPSTNLNPANAPEWLRRMLCCLAYEINKAKPDEESSAPGQEAASGESGDATPTPTPKVSKPAKIKTVLLALSTCPDTTTPTSSAPTASSPTSSPSPSQASPYSAKLHERALGHTLANWCTRFAFPHTLFTPDALPPPTAQFTSGGGGKRRGSSERDRDTPNGGYREREKVDREKPSLVERPPASIAMQGATVGVLDANSSKVKPQENGGEVKVIRLLTRGTKLDP